MPHPSVERPASALRLRMLEDMAMRGLRRATLIEAIASAPDGLDPVAVLQAASRTFAPRLEDRRSFAKPRQDLIMATPALHERELLKLHALSDALSDALTSRGVERRRALLAAQVGLAAFVQASQRWMDDPANGLGAEIDTTFADFKTLLASVS